VLAGGDDRVIYDDRMLAIMHPYPCGKGGGNGNGWPTIVQQFLEYKRLALKNYIKTGFENQTLGDLKSFSKSETFLEFAHVFAM
jgi:hypothetical protein